MAEGELDRPKDRELSGPVCNTCRGIEAVESPTPPVHYQITPHEHLTTSFGAAGTGRRTRTTAHRRTVAAPAPTDDRRLQGISDEEAAHLRKLRYEVGTEVHKPAGPLQRVNLCRLQQEGVKEPEHPVPIALMFNNP